MILNFLFIVLILISVLNGIHKELFYERDIYLTSSLEPQTEREVIVYYNEPWLFSDTSVSIYYRTSLDEETLLFDTEIRNDGKRLTFDNITLLWRDKNTLLMTLDGEEQKTVVYKIDFFSNTKPNWELLNK